LLSIERPVDLETTARGAAMLAAVGAGVFESKAQAAQMSPRDKTFAPEGDRDAARAGWKLAVRRAQIH
jgi:glycerol kinase